MNSIEISQLSKSFIPRQPVLDRWSVSYAAEVAADGSKQPITRYLAMQQLRSSYFWRSQANRAFQTANTEGFEPEMLQRVARQKAMF